MVTEIEKRIEEELESIWNGERKEVEYKFKNFDTGFRAGAKFILEMPELREAVHAIKFINDNYESFTIWNGKEYIHSYDVIEPAIESLKKAGLCE